MTRALWALLGLPLLGCGYLETHDALLRAATAPTGREAEVYVGAQSPPRPFYEIALLQVVGHGTDADMEDVTRALAVRAAILGCDAVVRVHVDQGYMAAHGFGVGVKYAVAAAAPASPGADGGAQL